MLLPINRTSVVDAVVAQLQAQILHGAWEVGSQVPTEAALTKELGVSRSTVREALNRLASRGLVEIHHGGRKLVQDFRLRAGLELLPELLLDPDGLPDLRVVRDVTELRSAVTPDVARLAAQRRSDGQAAELARIAGTLAQGVASGLSLEGLMAEAVEFWSVLVAACGNLAYRLMFNSLRLTHAEGRPTLARVIVDELRSPLYTTIATAVAEQAPDRAGKATAALVALGARALFAAVEAAYPEGDVR